MTKIQQTTISLNVNDDYIEGFNAGEAHTVHWVKEFKRLGMTLEQIIAELEREISTT